MRLSFLVGLGLALCGVRTPPSARAQAPSCTFGAGALPVDTLPPGALHGSAVPIDHIVVLMQENRSYDHYFGKLRRKSGPQKSASIRIEGHTSSEGSTEYNQSLSERRAQAVVADLAKRGIAASRLSALGVGEARPIAGNDDESGRSLNRRVEVICQ